MSHPVRTRVSARWVLACLASAALAIHPAAAQAQGEESQPESKESPVAHTNRLAGETSPYLLQHAHNPVDWYPWGEEALAASKEENKPIFLSVGYSACHWCHVMERESFESEAVAEILNEHFISIKVDREERPDVDEIYMAAVQAMTGSGGWPMSVFLTPDLKPFYGGTYFPPEDAYGRPGFKTVLNHIAKIWNEKRDAVKESANRLTDHMQSILSGRVGEPDAVSTGIIDNAVKTLGDNFDRYDGGFGDAPKFPSSASIELLLRAYDRSGDEATLTMATTTLDKMMRGGIYDHLGGGFARYSVDAQWLVPHFEKMLYDNAQLAKTYLEAYQLTGDEAYRRAAEETFAYILREMTDENGGFYSAEDADSEGQEGKFYIWEYDEIIAALGDEDGALLAGYYGLLRRGNFPSHEDYHKGENILHMRAPHDDLARELGIDPDLLREQLAPLREKLFAVREARVHPGLDDKILTSWNALMITAFAKGYQVLRDATYRDAAVKAARFVLDDMSADGELLRTHRKGESRLPAYLEDYAFMIDACVDLYEATFDAQWLDDADRLAQSMIEKFWDDEHAGFYFTSDDHKNLIVRTRPTYDGATPSGNSVATIALLRLAKLLDKQDYDAKARAVLAASHTYLEQAPQGFMKMMLAADFALYPPKEIAFAGSREGVKGLVAAVHGTYVPNKVLAFVDPDDENADALRKRVPLLAGKTQVDGKAAAYVCKDFACQKPVTEAEALLTQLDAGGSKE